MDWYLRNKKRVPDSHSRSGNRKVLKICRMLLMSWRVESKIMNSNPVSSIFHYEQVFYSWLSKRYICDGPKPSEPNSKLWDSNQVKCVIPPGESNCSQAFKRKRSKINKYIEFSIEDKYQHEDNDQYPRSIKSSCSYQSQEQSQRNIPIVQKTLGLYDPL